ncbi:MAG TPA: hypothetical protein VKU41_15600 [Polyangiaceae bacterium]|nr:hypothetical protein [Polyangiaceae bacterium]
MMVRLAVMIRSRSSVVALAIVLLGAIHCVDPEQPVAQPRVVAPNAAFEAPPEDASALEGWDATLVDCAAPEAAPPPPRVVCDGSDLQCQSLCPNGAFGAMLSGVVHDPAGKVPVPNAIVYVPKTREALAPLATGVSSCRTCSVEVNGYVSVAQTNADGTFVLDQVPAGDHIPLVVQAGKWRRSVILDHVVDCMDNAVDPSLTRLPRNRTEGDLPQMAALTSGCDDMACFLRRVGVDASEFTAPHAGGRVDVYRGVGGADLGQDAGGRAGDCTNLSCPLWSSKASLEAYDDVLLGCECDGNNQTKSLAAFVAIHDWLDEGGLLFATHSQVTWFENGLPDFKQLATWTNGPPSGAPGPFLVNDSFPNASTLLHWLEGLGAADSNGALGLDPARVSTSMTAVVRPALTWVTAEAADVLVDGSPEPTEGPKLVTFPTPVGGIPDAAAPSSCGTAVVSDVHAGGHGIPGPASIPDGCSTADLSAGELALEYYLLDSVSACVPPMLGIPPPPPPPPPPPRPGCP